uniref:Uncharacterized protein n=1 Tax=Vibrio parahaemolyticus TaxID=670 RepID=A0A7M3VIX6_VIBPH|nr:hypothetical protein VP201_00009 [Vibrio parahaemolyticus]
MNDKEIACKLEYTNLKRVLLKRALSCVFPTLVLQNFHFHLRHPTQPETIFIQSETALFRYLIVIV